MCCHCNANAVACHAVPSPNNKNNQAQRARAIPTSVQHDVYSGNPDNRFSLNTINFNNKACAEYRLWIIFKACFEEYGKAEERSSGFFLRKKTILEKLFKEAEANAEKKREREESKEGASL